jgi:transposase
MKRRKFTSKFKTKVVLEALKERVALSELAQKYELSPTQISKWKREFLDNASEIFESPQTDKRSDAEKEKDRLLKTIGSLKIENDFLKDALR